MHRIVREIWEGSSAVIRGEFKVHSLESRGTLIQDGDVGVIRVPATMLSKVGGRNSLVKVSVVRDERSKSHIRIARALTGKHALRNDEVALQYDDRADLGIRDAGAVCTLVIKPVNEWLALPRFLLGHSSPLVRREAAFAMALMVLGAIVGAFGGYFIGRMG